jgi:hypothetical protein
MTNLSSPEHVFLADLPDYLGMCEHTVRKYRILSEFPPPSGRLRKLDKLPNGRWGSFWTKKDLDDWMIVFSSGRKYDPTRDHNPAPVEPEAESSLSDAIMEALGEVDSDSDH